MAKKSFRQLKKETLAMMPKKVRMGMKPIGKRKKKMSDTDMVDSDTK